MYIFYIFQEVLNILYFKIIPTISQKFDSNFFGPKLTHTLYSSFWQQCVYDAVFSPFSLVTQSTKFYFFKFISYLIYDI
mgnify:CR=1 FL=1